MNAIQHTAYLDHLKIEDRVIQNDANKLSANFLHRLPTLCIEFR